MIFCSRCRQDKPIEDFAPSKSKRGYSYYCRPCMSKYQAKWTKKNGHRKTKLVTRCATRRCGKCRSCVVRRAWAEGKFANKPNGVRFDAWTADEDALLRELAGVALGSKEIAEAFKQHGFSRTQAAINCRANKALGLYLMPGDDIWSLQRVTHFFGLKGWKASRAWCDSGMLVAERLPPGHTSTRGRWVIKTEAIADFLRRYPWAYDPMKFPLQNHPLTKLAHQVYAKNPYATLKEVSERYGMSQTALRKWCHAGVIPFEMRASYCHGGRKNMVIPLNEMVWLPDEIKRKRQEAFDRRAARTWEARRKAS